MNEITTRPDAGSAIDDLIAKGDLSRLTPEQRVIHYHNVCRSIGLNPLTQPLQYVTLQGQLKLYARKDAADQLRKINGISVGIVEEKMQDGLLIVRVHATDKTGRSEEDIGVVSVKGLQGEALANATMKATTKAKRRVTLGISGLGFLDETEVDDARVQPTVSQSEIAKPALAMKAKPYKVEIKDGSDGADWRAWAQKLIAFARGETTLEGIAAWLEENDGALQDMRELEPKMYRMFEQAIDAHRQGIAPNVDEDTGEVM